MDSLMEIYLQSLADREDLPEESREYVEKELEQRSNGTAPNDIFRYTRSPTED